MISEPRLVADPDHNPHEESYLRWYQAITFADAGDEESSRRLALLAFSEDAAMMHREGAEDIGRKQYTLLRRFIDHYSAVLHHPTLVGHVSQVLHIGHGQRTVGQAPLTQGRVVM